MRLSRKFRRWVWRVSGAQKRIYTLELALSNETAEHAETKDRLREAVRELLAMRERTHDALRRKTDTVGGRVS